MLQQSFIRLCISWIYCHYNSLQGKILCFAVSSMQSNNQFIENKDFFILIKWDLSIIVQLFTVSIDCMNFIFFAIKHWRGVSYLFVRSTIVPQLFFQKFSTQGILILTPRQLNSGKSQGQGQCQNVLCHQCFSYQRKKDFFNLLLHPIICSFCQEAIRMFCLSLKNMFPAALFLWCFHQINRLQDAFLKRNTFYF